MAAREAWGLDLGQSAIRLVKIQRLKGTVQVVDYAQIPLEIASGEVNYEDPELIEIMARTVKEKNIGKTPIFASIPGQSSFFRDFPLPAISSGKLNEIVSYEARQQIPYPLEEVLWGYHHHEPEEDGAELSISLICCRHDIVNGLLNFLKTFGLNVAGIQVGPLALANYIMYDQPQEGTAMVLDAGARATDLLVFSNHHFWLRSIGGAGNELTSALMEKFNLPYSEAEDLKRKMGESKQADRVFQVVSPVLRGVTSEIQRSLGWYKSQHRGVRLSSLICAGGTFLLPGVKELIGENIRMPANLLGNIQNIDFAEGADAATFNRQIQTFGTALGLALQGVGEATMDINLLPPEVKLRQMIKAKFIYAVAIVALLAIMTMFSYFSASKQANAWDDFIRKSENVVGGKGLAKRQKNKLSQIQSELEPIKEKNSLLSQIAINRDDILVATGVVWKAFNEINQRRTAMINAAPLTSLDNVENLSELLFDNDEVKANLAMKANDYTDPKKLEEDVRAQCRLRAKQLIDRRRRIFIRSMEVETLYESWFIKKETDNDGNDIETLINPREKLSALNTGRRNPGGRGSVPSPMGGGASMHNESFSGSYGGQGAMSGVSESATEKHPPFHVVWINISGFSVSKPVEKSSDVISLSKEFENIPGLASIDVIPAESFDKNEVPVLAYHYGRDLESSAEKWILETEEIIEFSIELSYIPERYWDSLPSGMQIKAGK